MNTKLAGQRIQTDQAKIIKIYKSFSCSLLDIAKRYSVTERTIYEHLKKWGVEVDYTALQNKEKKRKHFKRRFSPELKAKMVYNTQVNNRHIRKCEFERSTEEQKLVANIIQHPYF